MKTLVLDRGPVGGGTTAAGMGHIVVMDDSEAQFALTAYSGALWRHLLAATAPGVEYDNCGTLWLAADEQEMAEVRRKEEYYAARGVRVEVLDGAGVAKAEPNLRPGMAGGLLVPDDGVLYPPCAARFLLEQAQRHGAEAARRRRRAGVAPRRRRRAGGRLDHSRPRGPSTPPGRGRRS